MKRQNISPQVFLERVRPMLGSMYYTALLITDNAEIAEMALQQAMLTVYLEEEAHDRRALREQLRRAVCECAFARLQEMPLTDAEKGDWHGINASAVVDDPICSTIMSRLNMEDRELQRYLLLRYGCGVPHGHAAEAAGMESAQAKEAFNRFRARAAGAHPEAFERSLARMCRKIPEESSAAPDMSPVCRAFERDAVMSTKGKTKRRNLAAYIFGAIGILICAILFWLFAVLLEPDAPTAAGELSRVFGMRYPFL